MKIIIHGGFFSESDQSHEVKTAKQESLQSIAKKAFDYLTTHSAFDTVAYAVSLLEDDPLYNAGIGSQIQSDGVIRMSAAIMNGDTQKLSGVINIENVQNPIFVAKDLINEDDRVLGGNGAKIYATENGFENFSTETPQRRKEYEAKLANGGKGTVGCVAIDHEGKLAVATSTGGKGFEIPGRISDSATVAGNYANAFCAVSCTGVGEDIVSNATAAKIVTRVTDGMNLQQAFAKTFEELKTIDGFAGAIAIDKDGNIYHQDSYPTMVFASFDGENFEVFS
ncbi:Isoaspartyl peptidase/L-asparaginase precursor [Chryseobacterium gleum]|uniref:Isoaspartyl peptidase n=2 Tax=Chryseobacterium gleum TaxID=250 RepID=A0A448AYU7_CHRGE|nr:isoaspartyl peptidase/L-asparaginase [Chryseobacterium gleum]EFK34404.1 isoaspartyl peptidase/L-asparaginase domain protein [Chryseobacterium gleum ATCC 35910]MCD9615475.1 isoaspartyl peptidase/L-asparaginase [Chryseobacterium gleum]MCE4066147.1 isoaspartyl peptidase/L-asparaginase [Chryseobacterium gleum]QQY30259.1 isoaspartyl peptidase/L-asparaginase [Chryseobacterium gleum]VEE05423.1 Isoaspartyl peptidase/L-asparaginase precursor [Chryseobacterium gleum]